MPSPIGHALSGIAFRQARPGVFFAKPWHEVVFFLFLANLPDLDFLPGILAGFPNTYHHGIVHSLGFAVAAAAAGGWLFHHFWKRSFRQVTVIIFLMYVTHLLLDYFAGDTKPPYGMPLFWPFSNEYFLAPRPLFLNIVRSSRSNDFFSSLFNRHNLEAALREIMILGGIALAAWLLRRWWEKRKAAE
jgi:inner membrane protein